MGGGRIFENSLSLNKPTLFESSYRSLFSNRCMLELNLAIYHRAASLSSHNYRLPQAQLRKSEFGGLDWNTGLLDWITGLDHWTTLLVRIATFHRNRKPEQSRHRSG